MTVYPLSAIRTLALHAQGLTDATSVDAQSGMEQIQRTVEQINYVQIDTLNLIQRAQYIVLWSRLGTYSPADFDRLIYTPEHRTLFEGVKSVAAILPLRDYRYQLGDKDRGRDTLLRWYTSMLKQEGIDELVPLVLERIRREGPLRGADFEYKERKRGSWWDWKPAKTALEYLFATGDLMVTDRVNFQRVYDLTERVLPEWVDRTPPSIQERDRFWVEQGLLATGVCLPEQVADYGFHMRKALPKSLWTDMVNDNVLIPVQGILQDGQAHELVLHRQHLGTLHRIADGEIHAQRTTFLSFFDSLFWCRGRDVQLWNYRNIIEAYVPEAKRQYGYFCQSILHKDQLVGRFDPKLERKTGTLRIKALYLEDGVEPDDELVSGVATAMCDFMKFHNAKELVIEKSQPEEFGGKVMKVL